MKQILIILISIVVLTIGAISDKIYTEKENFEFSKPVFFLFYILTVVFLYYPALTKIEEVLTELLK